MKRTSGLKSDPAKAREWQQRSRERAAERQRERPRAGFSCTVCGGKVYGDRKTCSRDCAREAIARAKRGDRNPMRRPVVARSVSASMRARNAERNDDVVALGKCIRPGCPNQLRPPQVLYCSQACNYRDSARVGRRRDQPYHRCRNCQVVFPWNGKGKGVYCSDGCAHQGCIPQEPDVVHVVRLRGHRKTDWESIVLGRCARPGCGKHAIHRHHVVFSQHVVGYGGDRWDPRNCLPLCGGCHADLHQSFEFPLSVLPDAAVEFAVDLRGAAAYDYLTRRYGGSDPRVEAILVTAGSIAADG